MLSGFWRYDLIVSRELGDESKGSFNLQQRPLDFEGIHKYISRFLPPGNELITSENEDSEISADAISAEV